MEDNQYSSWLLYKGKRAQVDSQLVIALQQLVTVISAPQFGECR